MATKPTNKIIQQRLDILAYTTFYQTVYKFWEVEEETKRIEDKKENAFCLLLEYVEKQSAEVESLQKQIFDLTKLNIQQNAKLLSSELNKLREISTMMEKLKEIDSALTGAQHHLKGVTASCRENSLEWVDELKTTVKTLNDKSDDISPSDVTAVNKLAKTVDNIAVMLREKQLLIADIRSQFVDIEEVAVDLKYLQLTETDKTE